MKTRHQLEAIKAAADLIKAITSGDRRRIISELKSVMYYVDIHEVKLELTAADFDE